MSHRPLLDSNVPAHFILGSPKKQRRQTRAEFGAVAFRREFAAAAWIPRRRRSDPAAADAMSDTNPGEESAGASSAGSADRVPLWCGRGVDGDKVAEEEGSGEREDPAAPAPGTASVPCPPGRECLLHMRKLILLLDLDHTLLNSTRIRDLSPPEQRNGLAEADHNRSLFQLNSDPNGPWITKLRPYVRDFLEKASTMFEMHVCTSATMSYASDCVELLDPNRVHFGTRIVSSRKVKSLDDVGLAEERRGVVIVDDSEKAWVKDGANLVLMDRYIFFASSLDRARSGISRSLAEQGRDEPEHGGPLAMMLDVLRRIHQRFFGSEHGGVSGNVRQVIRAERSEVLRGCRVAFSRFISQSEAADKPSKAAAEKRRMRWTVEQLGAVRAADVDAAVTHVVAADRSTGWARWAVQHGKFLVHPNWLHAANYTWIRAEEEDFPVAAVEGEGSRGGGDAATKLILVLGLDLTLLNSTKTSGLSTAEESKGHKPRRGLFRLDSVDPPMLAKLRPYVHEFLQQASTMFQMHLYTVGARDYAMECAKLLDPHGAYFGTRIIPGNDSRRPDVKRLDAVVPADERDVAQAVVILDDTAEVWGEHEDNLILMPRYFYFTSALCEAGYGAWSSRAERNTDEPERGGPLAMALDILRRVHVTPRLLQSPECYHLPKH